MRIGISGHQNIGKAETIDWVRREMLSYLTSNDVSSGLSSLAVGADQLFAETVLELERALEVVVPCLQYETTFKNPDDIRSYRNLLHNAKKSYQLEFPAPSEDAFYAAGRFIVDMSDMMILVWDGRPAGGLGGTGDIAKYVNAQLRPYLWINPNAATTTIVPRDK